MIRPASARWSVPLLAFLLAGGAPRGRAEDPPGRPRLVVQEPPGVVHGVAFSPDGRQLLSFGSGGARVWDLRTGRELRRLRDAHQAYSRGAFAPDGRSLAVRLTAQGTPEQLELARTVLVVDPVTGTVDGRLGPHTKSVTGLAYAPDGRRLATSGLGEPGLTIWDAETRSVERRLGRINDSGPAGGAIHFSADGRRVAAGWADHSVRLWDVPTGRLVRSFVGHTSPVADVRVCPDGRRLVTAGADGTARVWDVESGQEAGRFETGRARCVALHPDGSRLAYAGEDRSVRVVELATGKELRALPAHAQPVTGVCFSPDGDRLVSVGVNEGILVWDVTDGRRLHHLRERTVPPGSADVSADGRWLAVRGQPRRAVHLWDLHTGREVRRLAPDGNGYIDGGTFSPNGARLLTTGSDRWAGPAAEVAVWDMHTGSPVRRRLPQPGDPVWRDEQSLTVLERAAGRLGWRAWEVGTWAEGAAVNPPTRAPGWAVAAAGPWVAAGEGDAVVLLDRETGRESHRFRGHVGAVHRVAVAPDGRVVASSGEDRTVRVWDPATGRERLHVRGLTGPASTLVLSADGRFLAASDGPAVRLWDLAADRELGRLRTEAAVTSVGFTPGGRHVLTCGYDAVRVWDLPAGLERCRLVSFRDGTWAVVAPDGRFDAAELDAVDGLHWVAPDAPDRPLPPEIFMRDYYEPKLLARVLAGEPFKPIRSVAELNRVQPAVKVARVEPQPGRPDEVRVTVEVAGRAGTFDRPAGPLLLQSGAADLHLFRDGQLVARHPAEDGEVRLDPKTGRAVVTFDHVRLPRTEGKKEVEFSAYAFNADRVKSDTHRLTHPLPADRAPRKGSAYVVCVGVNAFDTPSWDLRYAAADARVLSRTLADALGRSDRFDRVAVVTLVSDSRTDGGKRTVTENTATKENVRAVLDLLAGREVGADRVKRIPGAAGLRQARPEDLVLLAFSTHGHNGADGRFYLLPADVGPGQDRVTDALLARAVSTDELSAWLRGVDAGEMVMVVDACHSAGSVEGGGFKPGPMGSRGLGQLAYDKRMRILAASQAADVAFEDPRIGHGLLTYALCRDGLADGRADFAPADGKVLLGEWLRFGERRVPELADEIAAGKVRAVGVGGRDLRPAGGDERGMKLRHEAAARRVAQRPSLFDFTKGRDGVTLVTRPDR